MGKANDTGQSFLKEATNESGLKECVEYQHMEPRRTWRKERRQEISGYVGGLGSGLCSFTELMKERLEIKLEGLWPWLEGALKLWLRVDLVPRRWLAVLLCLGKLGKGWWWERGVGGCETCTVGREEGGCLESGQRGISSLSYCFAEKFRASDLVFSAFTFSISKTQFLKRKYLTQLGLKHFQNFWG